MVFSALTRSRYVRHFIGKVSNSRAFQPVFDIMSNRTTATLHSLGKLGLSPDLVIDAGAYNGDWTIMTRPIFPAARFLMIEAQPSKTERLKSLCSPTIDFVPALLGSRKQQGVTFFLAETGSSLYSENTAFARQVTQLDMTTLDDVLPANPGRILFKLDVQGAELDVLKGATRALATTDAVLMEISLVQYNAGAPQLAETVAAMADLGFLAIDISDLRRIGDVLAQVDIVFAPRNGTLAGAAQSVIANYGRR